MKRTKSKKAELIPETPKIELVPADLKLKWDGLTAVATAFSVLDKGYFPHSYGQVVKQSLQFLAKLHENMAEEALKHPQAHMIPELKEFMKEGKAENGTQTEAN